ncbi:hypothetical protein ABZS66_17805 [Dactylosporangium sp. NPDC005572]|uniref:hypothetical protein n=1 Tax=Dactylosporangium sp. NPDC005572 TaxID=3156889 RepID=UPI0033A00D48
MTVLHADGWTVESSWLDRDGTGERNWNRVIDPWGAEHWCTTSQLQELLHRHGLDIGDLTYAAPPDRPAGRGEDCE